MDVNWSIAFVPSTGASNDILIFAEIDSNSTGKLRFKGTILSKTSVPSELRFFIPAKFKALSFDSGIEFVEIKQLAVIRKHSV